MERGRERQRDREEGPGASESQARSLRPHPACCSGTLPRRTPSLTIALRAPGSILHVARSTCSEQPGVGGWSGRSCSPSSQGARASLFSGNSTSRCGSSSPTARGPGEPAGRGPPPTPPPATRARTRAYPHAVSGIVRDPGWNADNPSLGARGTR